MPPNPPNGWNVPLPLQIFVLICVVIGPWVTLVLNHWLTGRRTAKRDDSNALLTQHQGFIDKILRGVESIPELVEANEKLTHMNDELRGENAKLENRIRELENRISSVERDRDAWRELGQRVPNLQGQIETYDRLLTKLRAENDRLRVEKDKALRTVTELQAAVEGRIVIEQAHVEIAHVSSPG